MWGKMSKWVNRLACKKPKTTLLEVRRGQRYVLLMEVPSNMSTDEQRVLQKAVYEMRETLNHWLSKTEEPFMTVMTISGMPITVKEVGE